MHHSPPWHHHDLSAYPQCTTTSFVTETKVAINNTIDANLQCDYSNRGTWKYYPIANFVFENERFSSFKQTDRTNNI